MDRKTLIADEGMIYTDGNDVYGYIIHLAEGVDETLFYPITIEEYEALQPKEEINEFGMPIYKEENNEEI